MSIVFSSCTKNFEKYNTDNSSISNDALLIDNNNFGLFFPLIQQNLFGAETGNGVGDYQVGQNLNADCYSGYMMSANAFRSNINNLNYFLVDGWNSSIYTNTFSNIVSPIQLLITKGLKSVPDFYAVALILQVDAIGRCTDRYGPIPYSKLTASTSGAIYDSQADVYNLMFSQLDTAVLNLQTYIAANPGFQPFANYDLIFGGDYTMWLKFANSLRLRLAMRIAKINPALAKTQGEKALDVITNGGILSAATETAKISGFGYQNPLYLITQAWTDISMGASAESIMVGYNDPRLAKYFDKSTFPSTAYKGIRIGINLPSSKGEYLKFSTLNYKTGGKNATFNNNTAMIAMTASEVWFLKAEAALRGWTGAGDAQTDYETGISTSMQQWSVSAGSYIQDNTSKPINYVDPVSTNSAPAVSTATIAWNASASNEQKLEKIITQKWIAMFPEGCEAWAEYRRTGYPKLFPVLINNSGGTINSALQIRRLAYPQSEYNSNATNIAAAVALLGGADNGGTPLWWDTNKGQAVPVNF